jgi:DNA-directed RNA polymerase subunit RPC12/RpoP
MSLPAGFVQIDLFGTESKADPMSTPATKPKRRKRKKGIVYRCSRCEKTIEIDIPAVVVVCGCGRRMEREERP